MALGIRPLRKSLSQLQKLYEFAPVWAQNTMVSAYGWSWQRRRFGGVFEEQLNQFKDRENFSSDQWYNYLAQELNQLLIHCFDKVPFYQEKWSEAGITRHELGRFSVEDLRRLPILTKQKLRKQGTSTLLARYRETGGEFFPSSGSTGTPTAILFSNAMHQRWSAAFEARIRHWAGVNRHMARGMIGGRRVVPEGASRPPYYRYNWFERQTYFSAYHIASTTVADYVKGMTDNHVEYMTGYAMSNFFLARFIQENGLHAPKMKAVITSSEKLSSMMRETFQEVYGCATYDSWSGIEACGLVSECEQGSLHISPDVGIIELLDEHGVPVGPGEVGEVFCTGFLNYDQPLIRYQIGDRMRLGRGKCACGRNMPVVEEIIGRVEDVVVGPDGRELVRFHGIFVGLPNIIEAQVIQWEIDRFEVKVVTERDLQPAERQTIADRMKSQLGSIRLEVNRVNDIPRTSNGKFHAVVSHVVRK